MSSLVFIAGCKSTSSPTGPGGGGAGDGIVHGVVTDSVTQKPIFQASIQIAGTTLQKLTDSLGNYTFDSLQVGSYFVTISKSGYISHSDTIKVAKGATTQLSRALASVGATGWTLVTSGTTQNLNGVCFGGGNLYVAGDNDALLRSTDGGLTWTALPSPGAGGMRSIVFTDKLHGMAATYYGVSITTDGGQTWVNRDLGGGVYESVAFIGKVAYAAGNDNSSEGIVSMSSDGGNQWRDVISPQVYLRSRMHAVAMASPTDICIAGVYGDVGVSTFSYIDWTTQLFQYISLNFYSVAMPNVKDIFVAGDSGAIIHCVDSGYHWTRQTTGVTTTLRCVSFFDGMTGLAVGDSGTILYTKNGGTTWQNMSLSGNNFSSCAFIDATDAVVVGKNGAIYRAKLP